jgi:hypothetical protein
MLPRFFAEWEADHLGTDLSVVRWWCTGWARAVYVVTGVAFGSAVSLTSASRGTERWLVWAALAISLTAASGAVFGYGIARWPEIAASHHPARRWVVVYLARVYGAALGMLTLTAVLSVATQQGASPGHRGEPPRPAPRDLRRPSHRSPGRRVRRAVRACSHLGGDHR